MWDNFEACADTFQAGDIVKVQVEVSGYNGRPQLTIKKLRKASEEEYSLADFQPHTTLSIDELWARLNAFVDSFTDPYLQQLVRSFLDDPEVASLLRTAPAAKYLHHAWIGGLLEHIVSLLGLCDRVVPHYPQVHRDLVMTGAILHDIGKLRRTALEPELRLHAGRADAGPHHARHCDDREEDCGDSRIPAALRLLVEHMVLSHHGEYEFGSPKLPMTPEAILLHYLDDLDAKMYTVRTELDAARRTGARPDEMTEWVRSLERPLLDGAGVSGQRGLLWAKLTRICRS